MKNKQKLNQFKKKLNKKLKESEKEQNKSNKEKKLNAMEKALKQPAEITLKKDNKQMTAKISGTPISLIFMLAEASRKSKELKQAIEIAADFERFKESMGIKDEDYEK